MHSAQFMTKTINYLNSSEKKLATIEMSDVESHSSPLLRYDLFSYNWLNAILTE